MDRTFDAEIKEPLEITPAKERKARKTKEELEADIAKYGYAPASWLEKDIISNEISKLMHENPDMPQKQAIAMAYQKAKQLMNPSRYIPNYAFGRS